MTRAPAARASAMSAARSAAVQPRWLTVAGDLGVLLLYSALLLGLAALALRAPREMDG
jgi:hypothetical protein